MTALHGIAQALLAPRNVALIGASATEGKHTSLPQRYLRAHGFTGGVYPVNPKRTEVFGERAYPTVQSIGKQIDHALIMVPTHSVEAAVRDCAGAGVRCATILSDGFAEAGDTGAKRQAALLDIASAHGMRILGPNSLGIVNPIDQVALSANEILSIPHLPTGKAALISQSGSMLGAILSRGMAREQGFSRMISVGNEADIGVAEAIGWLLEDSHTDVILLFLETLRDAPAFRQAAIHARQRRKPLVAFRLGRSSVGAQLSASHTGAMAGGGAAFDSFLRDCGVICVEQIDTLLEMPRLLHGREPCRGRKVAVMSTTGGGGGLVVDSLCERGAIIAPPSAAVRARLREDDIELSDSPLIDLTLAGANPKTYGAVLNALTASPEYDLVVTVVGSSAQFRPDRAVHPIIEAQNTPADKPVLTFIVPEAPESIMQLRRHGLPAFGNPEVCADAALAYLDWRDPRILPDHPGPDTELRTAAAGAASGQLNAAASQKLMGALGIAQPDEFVLPPARAWTDAELSQLPFPVAAKILSARIAHKSDVGGVELNLGSAAELRSACLRMLERVPPDTDAGIDGIQVQAMHTGIAELLVGYHRDPTVGPVISVGLGGVLTEIHRDVAIRPAPVDVRTARDMIAELRGAKLLEGFRGKPAADVDAAAAAVSALSRLALWRAVEVRDAEINPLLVKASGQGCIALDGLVVLSPQMQDDEALTP